MPIVWLYGYQIIPRGVAQLRGDMAKSPAKPTASRQSEGPSKGIIRNGPGEIPQTPRVSPKSSGGTSARLDIWSEPRINPPRPAVVLTTNLPVSWAERLILPCSTELTKRTGYCRLSKKLETPVRTGRGTIKAYRYANGRKAILVNLSLRRNMVRLKPSNGSLAFGAGTFVRSSAAGGPTGSDLATECFPETAQPDRQSRR